MSIAVSYDTQLPGIPDVTEREEVVQGTLTFSGNYPAGGDTLSFAGSNKVQSRRSPNRVEIYEEPVAASSQVATGASFAFAKGSTQANGLLQINTAYNTPLSAAAYPAAFTSPTTTVKFRAWFSLGQ